MEVNRGYEPELQKMAAFLKERCDRGQYGLTYTDPHKTRIRIPWPTVPRQNEDISENFGMFTEWAILSFRKRGNRCEQLENEPLSAQKHRFRNALARADGLRQVKELSNDNVRVYEFVDTKRERDHAENGHSRHDRHSPSQHFDAMDIYRGPGWVQHPMQPGDMSDSNSTHPDWDQSRCSPSTVTSSPNQTPAYLHTPYQAACDPMQPTEMQSDEREPSLGTLLEEMMNTPEPPVQQYAQTNGGYHTYTVPQPVRNGGHTAPAFPMDSTLQVPNYHTESQHQAQIRQPEHHMVIKTCFLGEEVMSKPVYNSKGFRLYSGNNVPDMRRLLDHAQRNQLQMLTKYPCEELFGPEFVDQVEMPLPRGPAHRQGVRTLQVIENMDRGVLFLLDYPANEGIPYNPPTIPNVFALRLCQTRVFPFDTNVQDPNILEEDGLKRMQFVQIFDGAEFLREMRKWVDCAGPTPSSTISLSVGQKPKREKGDCNLVTVTISVTKAKLMVEQYFEEQMVEICISDKSSMDRAAQQHKNEVQSRIMLDDTHPY